ncbi:unnamed protein product, partial [Mortierella alpina]
ITALINSKLVSTSTTSAVTAIVDESHFRAYMVQKVDGLTVTSEQVKNMVLEVLQNQQLILDRLALIKQKAEAILMQNFELLEYTIPRLFIVLPETSTSRDPAAMFRTKFRLHFICECGEHTISTGSTIHNHLHLAKHKGYIIREPTEFFKKYGPFLMLMLEMLKVGATVAGIVVPALSSLKVVDIVDSTQSAISSVTSQVIEGVDYTLAYLEQNRAQIQNPDGVDVDDDARPSMQDLTSYLNGVEGLEGTDLRQLGSFLAANSSDNLLGNLYRMTTDKGHVKWVCIDHYRLTYKEKDQQAFATAVLVNGGTYDPQLGQVVVSLGSKIRAAEFFDALAKARRIDDLNITFDWECDGKDLESLRDALGQSRVSILRLDVQRYRPGFRNKLRSPSAQYGVLFRIIEHPSMKLIHIVLPKEFINLSIFPPTRPSHLQKLSFEMVPGSLGAKDFGLLSEVLKTNSTLTTLKLESNKIGDDGAQALAEALKTNKTVATLNLRSNSIGDDGAKAPAETLKTNKTLTSLDLQSNQIGSDGVKALAEALKTNSTVATLDLSYNKIGDDGAKALAEALKTNSTVTTLDLYSNKIKSDGAKALSEARKTNSTVKLWT